MRPTLWRVAPTLALLAGLLLILTLLRAAGLFGPLAWRALLPLSFVLMAALPWLLLDAEGRRAIGLRRGTRWRWFALALVAGPLAAWGLGELNLALFGAGPDNPYATIAASYRAHGPFANGPLWQRHLVFTLPAMLFSPIGEELFFRGLLQQGLAARWRMATSVLLCSLLFGLVHLLHHGLLLGPQGWQLLPLSGGLWVLQMTAVAAGLAGLRLLSGSLLPCVLAHAAFNGAMNQFLFSRLA